MGKLVNKSEIEDILKKLKAENKTIVFTNGCFDILHVGHVKYLQKIKHSYAYLQRPNDMHTNVFYIPARWQIISFVHQ
jgi:FAD synthase